jgi:hypothetical protein
MRLLSYPESKIEERISQPDADEPFLLTDE